MVARCSETNAWNGIRSFYRDLENSLECYSEDLPSSAKPMGHKVSSSVIQSINQLWLGLRFTLYSHFFSFLAFVCKGDGGGWFSLFSFTLLVIGRVRSRVYFPDSLFVLLVLQPEEEGGGGGLWAGFIIRPGRSFVLLLSFRVISALFIDSSLYLCYCSNVREWPHLWPKSNWILAVLAVGRLFPPPPLTCWSESSASSTLSPPCW